MRARGETDPIPPAVPARIFIHTPGRRAKCARARLVTHESLSLSLSPLSSSNDSGNSIPRVAVCASSLSLYLRPLLFCSERAIFDDAVVFFCWSMCEDWRVSYVYIGRNFSRSRCKGAYFLKVSRGYIGK